MARYLVDTPAAKSPKMIGCLTYQWKKHTTQRRGNKVKYLLEKIQKYNFKKDTGAYTVPGESLHTVSTNTHKVLYTHSVKKHSVMLKTSRLG